MALVDISLFANVGEEVAPCYRGIAAFPLGRRSGEASSTTPVTATARAPTAIVR